MSSRMLNIFLLVQLSYMYHAEPQCVIDKLDEVSWQQCGNRGYAVRCKNRLDSIPQHYPLPNSSFTHPLCLLDLSGNDFTTVKNDSFVHAANLNTTDVLWLWLDNSSITHIESNAFENFTSLLYLNLSDNSLNQSDSLGPSLFKPLISLENINLKNNYLTENAFKQLGRELQYLKQLTGLYIDLCENCTFGSEFQNLTHLQNLSLSGRTDMSCHISRVTNNTFEYLKQAKRIWMSSCHIKEIEAGAFSGMENLQLLDISYNEDLKFSGMNKALFGLRNSKTLQELNVDKIHEIWETGIELKVEDIENLKTLKCLETVHMDLNKIEVINESILHPYQLPQTLRDFTLSGNRLTYGRYTQFLHFVTNITKLDISRQHIQYDPFWNSHSDGYEHQKTGSDGQTTNNDCSDCQNQKSGVICFPPDLERLYWRKSFVNFEINGPIFICNAQRLRQFTLSFNLITKWRGTIHGLDNLTYLDLSENYCDEVNPAFFKEMRSIIHLNLSANFLGPSLDPENQESSDMFTSMLNISVLDLSNNRIWRLPRDIFRNNNNLKVLNLANNLIEEWNSTLNTSQCLTDLDLSGNRLTSLPKNLTEFLDSAVHFEACNGTGNVNLNLSGNPLECVCSTLPFLKWILKSDVKVKGVCHFNGNKMNLGTYHDVNLIIKELESKECTSHQYTWIITIGCSTFTAFLSIVVSVLLYRNRWKLRYLYYSRNRRHIHRGYDRLFENDAFFSYASENASFIKSNVVPVLEGQHQLRLWVADRNSAAGVSVAENITHAIYNSRKAVLLVDLAYLKDKWCDYEMNMAVMESVETQRKMVILVLFEPIPMNELPLGVMQLLRSERSVDYPDNCQDVDTFWMNLADEIRSNA